MKHKDILAIYKAGPEAVIKLIDSFMATITELKANKELGGSTEQKIAAIVANSLQVTGDDMEPIALDKIEFFSKSIGSLVLLEPILKRMKIAEIIDRICPADKQQILSHGKTVEMLVCNRLLSPQPLYRVEEWAKNAGIKEVYNIDSSLLNDDRIAKTLDAINSSRAAIKTEIALRVSKSFQIPLKQIHWDLTSFHFEGEYDSQGKDHIQIVYSKNHPNESAKKSAKVGLDVAKDEYGQVPIYYEELDGNASGTAATIQNMENLKKHLRLDNILRISDRGCFSPKVAIKTTESGFNFISSIDLSKSYKDLFFECKRKEDGITWQKLSYLSINQQKKKDKDRDYYYGFETSKTFEYNGTDLKIRIIFIKSDGKLRRDKKTESKRISFINEGFERINSKISRPRYRTTKEVKKRINTLLSKYPDYGQFYSPRVIQNKEKKPIKVTYSVDTTLLKKKRMLYGIYVIGTSLDKSEYPMDRVFSIFKEQHTVENAHKVLKGPVRLRPIFLHRQERIESLILVIFFALMVYHLLERTYYYHQKEQEKKKNKKEQKTIRKMTARGLFWMFNWYSLGIIHIGGHKILRPAKLNKNQQEVFNILGLPHPDKWLPVGPRGP